MVSVFLLSSYSLFLTPEASLFLTYLLFFSDFLYLSGAVEDLTAMHIDEVGPSLDLPEPILL